MEPPQADGGKGIAGIVDNDPLHPPSAVVVSSHAANDAFIDSWLWQTISVLSEAQLNTIAGAADTVNVFVHVTGAWQSLVTVNVTTFDPPQAEGGPVLLLVSV